MFKNQGLFNSILCPNYPKCSSQSHCIYNHIPPTIINKKKQSNPVMERVIKRSLPENTVVRPALKVRKVEGSNEGNAVASSSKLPITKVSKPIKSIPVTGPPRIVPTGATHTAFSIRSKMLSVLYTQFLLDYSKLPNQSIAKSLASIHSAEQEKNCYTKSNKAIYKQSIISTMTRLKKRGFVLKEELCGTLEEETKRNEITLELLKGKLTLERVSPFISNVTTLSTFDYIVEVPSEVGGSCPTEVGKVSKCSRCGTQFLVKELLNDENKTACNYHWGRMVTEKLGGIKSRVFSCCPGVGAVTCVKGAHTFKDETAELLHSRIGFVKTSSLNSVSTSTKVKHAILALDCELVYTTSGMSVARLTVIDEQGQVILDEYIKPLGTILDLVTRFSGITQANLDGATKDLQKVREQLGELIDEKTVIVGHGLENDLKAMRLVHLNVIDTAIIYPHPRGGTFRHALRNLTRDVLGKFIQADLGSDGGHDSLDDSRCALELLRHKVKQSS